MDTKFNSNKTSSDKEFYQKIELDKLNKSEMSIFLSKQRYTELFEEITASIEKYILSTQRINQIDFDVYDSKSIFKVIRSHIMEKEKYYSNDFVGILRENPDHKIEITYQDYAHILYKFTTMNTSSTTEPVFQIMKDEALLSLINEAVENYEKDPLADAGILAKQVLIKIIGIRIRKVREKRCYTYKYLSQRTGLSVAYLNKIEHGNIKKFLKPTKMYSIKTHLDCSWEYLLGTTPFFKMAGKFMDLSNISTPYTNMPMVNYPLINLFLRVINQDDFNEKEMEDYLSKKLSL